MYVNGIALSSGWELCLHGNLELCILVLYGKQPLMPVIRMEPPPPPSDYLQDRRLVVRRTYEVTWEVAWWYLR